MAAKKRKAAAPSGQLFPEALQHQRQLTMTVMVPAETARVIAAEQARRDRAKGATPNRRRPKGTRLANARKKTHCVCPNKSAAKRRTTTTETKKTVKRVSANTKRRNARLALILTTDEVRRWYASETFRVGVWQMARKAFADSIEGPDGSTLASAGWIHATKFPATKFRAANPRKPKRRAVRRKVANVQRRGYVVTLSKKETRAWWGGGVGARQHLRAAFERTADAILKKHPGAPVMVHDAKGMMVESWGRGVRL